MDSQHPQTTDSRAQGARIAFWVTLALISSSLEPILVKIGYERHATAFQFLYIKSIVGGLFIIPLTREFRWIGLKGIAKFIYITVLFIVTTFLVLVALEHLSAVMVITIITTTPAIVALLNQWKRNEVLGARFWVGFFLCLTGILLTLELNRFSNLIIDSMGITCAFASVFASALYRTRMDDLTKEFTPRTASTYIFVMNALCALLLFTPWIGSVPPQVLPLGIVIGCAAAVANVAFLISLYLLGSTRISIISIIQRPLVITAAALILKERLTLLQIAGILLVLGGIQLAAVKKEPLNETARKSGAEKEKTEVFLENR